MINIVRLRCEYGDNPIAIQTATPRFSWELESRLRGQKQSAYQIIVSGSKAEVQAGRGELWDSGKIPSSETMHIPYAGIPLVSGQRCFWTVKCWDQEDVCHAAGDIATFATGILHADEWTAQWIGAREEIASPLFRTAFRLDKPVQQATLHISGLGYYELYVNGAQLGDHVLVPNWTDYDDRQIEGLLYPFDDQTSKRVHYLSYSLDEQLQQGENTIGVMLGNGFYNQTGRTVEGRMAYGSPRLIAQLAITYMDGTAEVIASHEGWACSNGPIVANNVFYGEVYDARLEQPGWAEPGFDDAAWERARLVRPPAGRLMAQASPPDRKIATLAALSRQEVRPGVYVVDFGQNFSGWVRLRMEGDAGRRVELRYAENCRADGELDPTSSGGPEQWQCDSYIMKGGGIEQYEPRFTWHGFRYVEISGYPGIPELGSVEGVVVHAAVEPGGHVACSEPLLNQIQAAYRWSQLTNLHGGVPSDCPHRERLGYTGDGHLTAEAAMLNFDMAAFYAKWVADIGDAQNRLTGFVPHTAPFNGGGGGVGWGSAYIIVPWLMYRMYGDTRLLAEHYAGMKQWMDYLGSRNREGGYLVEFEEPDSWFLGDWCVPGENELPPVLVGTFYYGYTARMMAQIAAALGYEADHLHYAELSVLIGDALHEAFFDPSRGRYSIGRQGADLFPLALGCVPPDAVEQLWAQVLNHYQLDLGGHLDTGIFGTSFLLELLSERGETDTALAMVLKREFPGYGYMIEQGATTLWESWDGHDSHNHPMFGTVSAWFYKWVAGIAPHPDSVAFQAAVFRPFLPSGMQHAEASIHTMRGVYAIRWEKRESAVWACEITIPPNCTGQLILPLLRGQRQAAAIVETVSGQQLWPAGEGEAHAPGIRAVHCRPEQVEVQLASGSYRFEVR